LRLIIIRYFVGRMQKGIEQAPWINALSLKIATVKNKELTDYE